MVLLGWVRDGHRDTHVGVMTVGGECLGTIDQPTVVDFLGGRARATRIRAGFGLGQRPAAQFLSLGEGNHVFLSLPLIAKLENVIRAKRIMRGHDNADGTVHARKLLDDDRVFEIAHARAAIFLGENNAEQPHLGEFGHNFRREDGGFVPLHHMRSDFGFGKLANCTPEFLLLSGQGEVHESSQEKLSGKSLIYTTAIRTISGACPKADETCTKRRKEAENPKRGTS